MAKPSLLPPAEVARLARQLADTGIGVTVLPATDLFLMGRDQDHGVRRGVADANLLLEHGVKCSLSSNNILNPATPYGDCSQQQSLKSFLIARHSMLAEINTMMIFMQYILTFIVYHLSLL